MGQDWTVGLAATGSDLVNADVYKYIHTYIHTYTTYMYRNTHTHTCVGAVFSWSAERHRETWRESERDREREK